MVARAWSLPRIAPEEMPEPGADCPDALARSPGWRVAGARCRTGFAQAFERNVEIGPVESAYDCQTSIGNYEQSAFAVGSNLDFLIALKEMSDGDHLSQELTSACCWSTVRNLGDRGLRPQSRTAEALLHQC